MNGLATALSITCGGLAVLLISGTAPKLAQAVAGAFLAVLAFFLWNVEFREDE